ncbi:MAG: response regulator [Rubrivivax sp.]|nr:response regulator [Rubrivivax sp.]
MTTAPEAPRPEEAPVDPGSDPARPPPSRRHVLLVDADPLLARLIEEWLAPEGLSVLTTPVVAMAAACCLVIVDLPYPRRTGLDSIREVASRHPGVPIIALSPTIFASVDACGTVSRSLGVDCVLAKPTSRDRLLGAVRRFAADGAVGRSVGRATG